VHSSVLRQLTWLRSGDTWCAEGFIREAGQQLTSLSLDVDEFWVSTLRLLSEQQSLQELTLHRFQCGHMRDYYYARTMDFSDMKVSRTLRMCSGPIRSMIACALQSSTCAMAEPRRHMLQHCMCRN
jgi:hypothetical protein